MVVEVVEVEVVEVEVVEVEVEVVAVYKAIGEPSEEDVPAKGIAMERIQHIQGEEVGTFLAIAKLMALCCTFNDHG